MHCKCCFAFNLNLPSLSCKCDRLSTKDVIKMDFSSGHTVNLSTHNIIIM